MLFLLLILLASSSYAEDSNCEDVFEDTCFIKVENEMTSIFSDIKANDETLSHKHFGEICRYFDDSLHCVSDDIEYDCSEDVKREFLELSVESLRTVATDVCKDEYEKLKDIFQDFECWNIDDFLSCAERRANVDSLIHLLERPVGGEECLNLTQDIESCLEASKNRSCNEHKGIQSVKELITIFREEQCKNIHPKDRKVAETTAAPTETSEDQGRESASSDINSSASYSKESVTVGPNINITEVAKHRGTSDSNFSQVSGENDSTTEYKSSISEVTGIEITPSQAIIASREFTETGGTFASAIITSRFTETVSAATSGVSGTESASPLTTHTNSEVAGNGRSFGQDSTISSEVTRNSGAFVQDSTADSNFSQDSGENDTATEYKSSISEVTGTGSTPSQAIIASREFTETGGTFASAIITSRFTETVSATTGGFSGNGSASSLTTRTNSEVTGNGRSFGQDSTTSSEVTRNSGAFVQDSTVTTKIRGTFAQTTVIINDVTPKAYISQAEEKETSAGSSIGKIVETESASDTVNPKLSKAMHVKHEASKNGGASNKAATFLTFEFCFMLMPFVFLF